jgi:hypothetical protein
LTGVNTSTAISTARVRGWLRSMRGHSRIDGGNPRRRRRRSSHTPNGITSSPAMKMDGRTMKKMMPRYGFE